MMQISQCAILLRNKWLKNPIKLNGKVKDRKLCNKKGVCSKQKVVVVNKAKLSNLAKKTKNENRKLKEKTEKKNKKDRKERKLSKKDPVKKLKSLKLIKPSKKSNKKLKSSKKTAKSPVKERRLLDKSFDNKWGSQNPFRNLSDETTVNEQKGKVWKHDKKSIKKLENYAITSLMTLISLKVAQDANPKDKPASLVKTSRKLGLIGNFVKGKTLNQYFEKTKKDLSKYLKKKRISLKKNISTNAMEKIMKKYVQDRFKIGPKKFEVVRELITGLYKVGQKMHRKKD